MAVAVGWRVAVGSGVNVGFIVGALVGPCGCTTVARENVREAGVGVGSDGSCAVSCVGICVDELSLGTGSVANRAVMVACIPASSVRRTPRVRGTGVATGIGPPDLALPRFALPEFALPVAATAAVMVASKSAFANGTGGLPGVLARERATASARTASDECGRGKNRPLAEESLLRESSYAKVPSTPHPCPIKIES